MVVQTVALNKVMIFSIVLSLSALSQQTTNSNTWGIKNLHSFLNRHRSQKSTSILSQLLSRQLSKVELKVDAVIAQYHAWIQMVLQLNWYLMFWRQIRGSFISSKGHLERNREMKSHESLQKRAYVRAKKRRNKSVMRSLSSYMHSVWSHQSSLMTIREHAGLYLWLIGGHEVRKVSLWNQIKTRNPKDLAQSIKL